jgi:hypothetical protein
MLLLRNFVLMRNYYSHDVKTAIKITNNKKEYTIHRGQYTIHRGQYTIHRGQCHLLCFFLAFGGLMQDLVVYFVIDIGGIVDHYCLSFILLLTLVELLTITV